MKTLIGQSLPALPFVVTDSDGRILRMGMAPAQLVDLQAAVGEYVFAGIADSESDYIVDLAGSPARASRPASPVAIDKTTVAADATDVVTLSNVANGAEITIAGPITGTLTGDGSSIELTFEQAGQYVVTVSHFPALDFVSVIDAS